MIEIKALCFAFLQPVTVVILLFLIILLILLHNPTVNTGILVFSLRVSQYFTPLRHICHALSVPKHKCLQAVYIDQVADTEDKKPQRHK